MESGLATRYLHASVEALSSPASASSPGGLVVRVSSLKAIKEFMTILDNSLIAPHQASILRCVAEIGLSGAVKEDSLVLVLEVFTDAVNVSPFLSYFGG